MRSNCPIFSIRLLTLNPDTCPAKEPKENRLATIAVVGKTHQTNECGEEGRGRGRGLRVRIWTWLQNLEFL